MRFSVGIFLAIAMIWASACTKATLVGDELLEDQKANIIFKDDFDLTFQSIVDDSVQTYPVASGSVNIDRRRERLLLGTLDDPLFGKSSSELYFQLGINFGQSALALIEADIDSIVLKLTLDTIGQYGVENAPMDIEVREVTERLDFDGLGTEIFASQSFSVDEMNTIAPITTVIPRYFDTVRTMLGGDTTIIQELPHLRVKLDPAFFENIRNDTSKLTIQDTLNAAFNGIRVKVTSDNNTMAGINPIGVSGVQIYYDDGSEFQKTYTYNFAALLTVKTAHIQHDYTGSLVEPFIGEGADDSLILLQSMVGINTEMIINDDSELQGNAINDAVLELYAVELPEDDQSMYPLIEQIVGVQDEMDGTRRYSDDVIIALGNQGTDELVLAGIFGGTPDDPVTTAPEFTRYTFKITAQLQALLDGRTDRFIFSSFFKSFSPRRVIFQGKNHPQFAPRLKVTYSKQ